MMPDLDEGNQRRQEYNVYAAFFWGMLNRHIQLLDDGNSSRPIYRLSTRLVKDIGEYADNNNVLVVSNSTPCDNLYEVIDALSIYPALVNKIIENTEKAIAKEVDTNCSPEDGLLTKSLSEFKVREFPVETNGENNVRSIFDLPILVKKSVPTEQYYEEKVLKILDVSLSEIKKYVYKFCNESEAAPVIGNIIMEQYAKYLHFIECERKTWKKIVNDVLFITTCDKIAEYLEEVGQEELSREVLEKCEELRNN
jgi:dimeric dUTPase (all-alpha-NTP-PPase superfamily)